MSMHTAITVTGNTTADPLVRYTRDGAPFATFRVASNRSYFDRLSGRWQQSGTDYYDVTAFGALGVNVFESITKGDPVVVQGRLRIERWETEDNHGTSVKIQADAVGFDMTFGQGTFTRVRRTTLPGNDPMEDPAVRAAAADLEGGAGSAGREPEPELGAESGPEPGMESGPEPGEESGADWPLEEPRGGEEDTGARVA